MASRHCFIKKLLANSCFDVICITARCFLKYLNLALMSYKLEIYFFIEVKANVYVFEITVIFYKR